MTTQKGTAPWAVQVTFEHGGVALFGLSARNVRKLEFRLDRLDRLDAIVGDLPVEEWDVHPVSGKPKRRAAAKALPPLPEREHDPRYSRQPYVSPPEWTIAHELALEARMKESA
jgi:hypothetical protein